MLKKIINGILAGIMISIGGAAFLMCYPDHKVAGAVFFTIGLLTISWKGFSLYTGKIGLLYEKHSKEDLLVLFLGLIGNGIGSLAVGYLLGYAIPQLHDTAVALCAAKLQQGYLQSFIRAIFCGILIYVAVDIFNSKKTPLGILLGIPAFILSGFEHSIADMFYFSATIKGIYFADGLVFILLIVLGNSVGGLLIPTLKAIGELTFKKKPAKEAALAEAAADVADEEENSEKPAEE